MGLGKSKNEMESKAEVANAQERAAFVEDRIAEFKRENPQIEEVLRLFNVSREHFEASIAATQLTKTYVTTSTLLPSKHG